MRKLTSLLVVLVAAMAFAAEKATIADILKAPADFDKKVLTVTGEVDAFKAKTSKAGNAYYNFKLVDGKEKLMIYGQGRLEQDLIDKLTDGQKVTVTGYFYKETKVGSNTFKNEINVTKRESDEKTKDFGIVVIVKKGGR